MDIGGTHTDLVLLDDDGGVTLHKVASTNQAPEEAVRRALADLKLTLQETSLFAHGTTVATNAVIQRTGARTGLITTAGFRDVLQIRRTTRGELYDFQWDPPAELVPRRWRMEVHERTAADGEILVDVDLDAVTDAARALQAQGVESIAVAFINSYRNADNEMRSARRLAEAVPDLPVYLSSELFPAWREFERTSTAVVGAYVGPVLTAYLRQLEEALAGAGYGFDLMVMRSNGGLAPAAATIANPVGTLMSGPAAGVIAQVAIAGLAGISDLIGMDVGGTSTDISLVLGGAPRMRDEFEVEFGTVVGFPMIDIHSIGAGGGTVAWLDEGNMLHSGPRSAGADPGPACYQRGGTEATVTDAYVVSGRVNPHTFLGGRMAISAEAATSVIRDLGRRCGLETPEMAAGIITLTVSNVAAATRELTVERGVDPRELALVAYGGGGPTLACDLAEELEVPLVLVPPHPGLTSAMGLLLTDIRHDFVNTFLRSSEECDWDEVANAFNRLVRDGHARLEREGIIRGRRRFELAADLRYVGQTHELTVGLGEDYTEETHDHLSDRLRVAHQAEYGHAPEGPQPVEIVSLRVAAFGGMPRPTFTLAPAAKEVQPVGTRQLHIGGHWHQAPVYQREDIGIGAELAGPAIVEQMDTTTVLLPGWTATVDAIGSLLLRREGNQ